MKMTVMRNHGHFRCARTSLSISSLRGADYFQRWIRWPVRADCCATDSSIRGMCALRGRCARSWSGVEQSMAMDRY